MFYSINVFYNVPMKSRFLQSLMIYSINSFLLNLNDTIVFILYFVLNKAEWYFESIRFVAPPFMTYFVYVYSPLWTVLYAFGGFYFITSIPSFVNVSITSTKANRDKTVLEKNQLKGVVNWNITINLDWLSKFCLFGKYKIVLYLWS